MTKKISQDSSNASNRGEKNKQKRKLRVMFVFHYWLLIKKYFLIFYTLISLLGYTKFGEYKKRIRSRRREGKNET